MDNWETLGLSSGAAFITSVLTLLGWDRRIRKLEEHKVNTELCEEKHKTIENLQTSLAKIEGRLDKIMEMVLDLQRNGKK